MNALVTLRAINNDMSVMGRWLNDRFANTVVLASMSDRIEQYAQELKDLKAARIKDLECNGPKLQIDPSNTTITLLRDGKEVHHEFGDFDIEISCANDEYTCISLDIKGSADEDGFTHFIRASPGISGHKTYGVWITQEEGAILKKKFNDIDRHICSFCGAMESVCGADHSEDMRAAARESMRGHYDD